MNTHQDRFGRLAVIVATATLIISSATACSNSAGTVPTASSLTPARISKGQLEPPPTVTASNNSDIGENVTQSTPNCWAPGSANISSGDSQVFAPTNPACETGSLQANASTPSQDCELIWIAVQLQVIVVNSQGTNCTWTVTGPGRGIWAYQLASPARKRTKK